MKVSYYPGCSLDGTAREFGESVEGMARMLGVELAELPDWNCCGSSSAHATSEALAFDLAARNLGIAERAGLDLLVPCALCFSRLKTAQKTIAAGRTSGGISTLTSSKVQVKDSVDFLWHDVGEKAIRQKVKKSLKGLNPVCYYGCLTTRPPHITDAPMPEDPHGMDLLLESLGANVKNWSYKTECCGGSLTLSLPEVAHKLIQKLLDMAQEAGADCIVAACPMCHSNLDTWQREISRETGKNYYIPIFYFTELMGLSFEHPDTRKWLRRHSTDPLPFLRQKGLL
ncbi:MAG: CoB--CoM heterodisulfide reductase iron-sulfur subunit B family protein [Dehalococcoidia bacterium]|nr:CoB--CoM heterodisulfide reductase iron-sulfur subunit B family protein [Dehalococcoidia bacterium]